MIMKTFNFQSISFTQTYSVFDIDHVLTTQISTLDDV